MRVPRTVDKPVRTQAREHALEMFGMLGVTPSKPTLRRATDRIEKDLKRGGGPVQSPSPDAPVTLMGGTTLVEHSGALPSDIVGIHPSLRGLHDVAAIDRAPTYDTSRVAPAVSNAPISPLAQAIDLLDGRLSRAYTIVSRLEVRLVPVSQSAPPSGAPGPGADQTRPTNMVAAIEQIGSKLSMLGDYIETLTDRLLV